MFYLRIKRRCDIALHRERCTDSRRCGSAFNWKLVTVIEATVIWFLCYFVIFLRPHLRNAFGSKQARETIRVCSNPPCAPSTALTDAELCSLSQSSSQPSSQYIDTLSSKYDNTSSVVVFYNVYISEENENATQRGLDIVREQVAQIGETPVVVNYTLQQRERQRWKIFKKSPSISLFYVSLGKDLSEDYMRKQVCKPYALDCHRLFHCQQAYEDVTLASLHTFCAANPQKTVIYIHNKGSFHNTSGQYAWRWHMLEAILHPDCWRHVHDEPKHKSFWGMSREKEDTDDDNIQCDACGLLLRTLPSAHYHGNMWMARCSYINQLKPPGVLAKQHDAVIDLYHNLHPLIQFSFCQDVPWLTGTGRYFAEHWLGSHPSMRACDMSKTSKEYYWKHDDQLRNLTIDFGFDTAPRETLWKSSIPGDCLSNKSSVYNNTSLRLTDSTLLSGKLIKWCIEYNVLPTNESWIWDHYPDGHAYRSMLEGERSSLLSSVSDEGLMNCTRVVDFVRQVRRPILGNNESAL
jgi:hypothetical protein